MKLTSSQLRRIIREELEGSSAYTKCVHCGTQCLTKTLGHCRNGSPTCGYCIQNGVSCPRACTEKMMGEAAYDDDYEEDPFQDDVFIEDEKFLEPNPYTCPECGGNHSEFVDDSEEQLLCPYCDAQYSKDEAYDGNS